MHTYVTTLTEDERAALVALAGRRADREALEERRGLVTRRLTAPGTPTAADVADWEVRVDGCLSGEADEHRATLALLKKAISENRVGQRDPFARDTPAPGPRTPGAADDGRLICLLDVAPLAMALCPLAGPEAEHCRMWLRRLRRDSVLALIPESVDLSVRRELILYGRTEALARLDAFRDGGYVLPLTAWAQKEAARFWREACGEGLPTADRPALDADMLLAAQAATLEASVHGPAGGGGSVIVACGRVGHLARYCDACRWQEASPTPIEPTLHYAPRSTPN